MKSNNNGLWVGLIAVAILALGGYFFPQIQTLAGSVGTRFPHGLAVGTTASVTDGKLTVGNSGSALGNVIFGNCTLTVQTGTIAASTTAPYDCAVTGATAASTVLAALSTTTAYGATQVSGFYAVSAKASTTAGFITVLLFNGTGTANNPSTAGYASSTNYLVMN